MVHGCIIDGKKGLIVFWERGWGIMNSERYCERILPGIQAYIQGDLEVVYLQDNAPIHHSRYTVGDMEARGIPYLRLPPYSPDLNLIKHVWNWIKNWIQRYYYAAHYNPSKIELERLKGIIQEAWNTIPEGYIQILL
jgi:transposase